MTCGFLFVFKVCSILQRARNEGGAHRVSSVAAIGPARGGLFALNALGAMRRRSSRRLPLCFSGWKSRPRAEARSTFRRSPCGPARQR